MSHLRLVLLATIVPALALTACKKSETAPTNAAVTAGPAIPAPAGGWEAQVEKTPEGGFRMGNPQAPQKLVEYGSYTCPHCAEFDAEGLPEIRKLVATGKLSYELRNFVRDPYDLTAALLARCGGTGPFFKLSSQIYGSQQAWIGNAQNMTPADQQKISALPVAQQLSALARATGLNAFVGQRGVSEQKSAQCLADQGEQDKLVQMRDAGTKQYNIEGTPTFVLNGEAIGSADWKGLKPKLDAALGG